MKFFNISHCRKFGGIADSRKYTPKIWGHSKYTKNHPRKCALKVTPLQKTISLNSAAAVRASKKSSIIAYRKSTTRFPLSHR